MIKNFKKFSIFFLRSKNLKKKSQKSIIFFKKKSSIFEIFFEIFGSQKILIIEIFFGVEKKSRYSFDVKFPKLSIYDGFRVIRQL